MPSFIDLTGSEFGRLKVIKRHEQEGNRVFWKCVCQCRGKPVIVRSDHLRTGHTLSCGCVGNEKLAEGRFKHGAGKREERHPLYSIWSNMIQRCLNVKNKRYADYGGRGISICKEWLKYEPFRDYMLSLPNCPQDAQKAGCCLEREIDRIDNDGDYRPGNIRWSTSSEQKNNNRRTQLIKFRGQTLSLTQAAEMYSSVGPSTVKYRLDKGWSVRDALLKPAYT